MLEIFFSCYGFVLLSKAPCLINGPLLRFCLELKGPYGEDCVIQVYLRFLKREKIRRVTGHMIRSHLNLSHCMWSFLSEQRDNTHFLFITRIQSYLVYTRVEFTYLEVISTVKGNLAF